jgi:16S rRNA (uracil1498-N3)-methyltransferase
MAMHVFYEEKLQSEVVILSREESQHAARVLRLRAGEEIILTDGRGNWNMARLVGVNPDHTTAAITQRIYREKRAFQLHMAVAPTKNIDRFEWFLEKATECGVERITPLICEHSERTIVKTERLQKILLAAAKQSQRAWLPQLDEPVTFASFMAEFKPFEHAYIAHCAQGDKVEISHVYQKGADVLVLIGPEGDFSPKEVAMANERSIKAISLGVNRLRTETAALVACLNINFMNGELG